MRRKIVFLSGTRADFGKLKSLIEIINQSDHFEVHIFATGMHTLSKYGSTVIEIEKCGYPNIFKHINQVSEDTMDVVLAKTVEGFSYYCREIKPDLIVVHGDRVEALAGAIVGSLNNIYVAHIEGGEVSGTIDELIRHSISKLCHFHFVSNGKAKERLIQMGEDREVIFEIGSPDIDLMFSNNLPELSEVKRYYEICFENYAILMFHPVTTEFDQVSHQAGELVNAVIHSKCNFVVIYPNNDLGSSSIIDEYQAFERLTTIRMFPSIRFEYFLVLLKNADFILGNSSAGVREAPYYGIPTVNIGTRQVNRVFNEDIVSVNNDFQSILDGIKKVKNLKPDKVRLFGDGRSDERFFKIISDSNFWKRNKQKQFLDLVNHSN